MFIASLQPKLQKQEILSLKGTFNVRNTLHEGKLLPFTVLL